MVQNVFFTKSLELFRLHDLSPCKENDMSKSTASALSGSRAKRRDSTAGGGTSALDRLRYNLSPVTSYYKPLIRSFGRSSPSKSSKVSNFTLSFMFFHTLISFYFFISFCEFLKFFFFFCRNGFFFCTEKRPCRQR